MKKKFIAHIGLCAMAAGILLFLLHATLYPHSNLLLLTGLTLVLGGVVVHVLMTKRNSKY